MAAPNAMTSERISLDSKILSRRARSTLRIFPRRGKMAWKRRSRACLADPPADSPSTRYSSDSSGLREEQSASFPGSVSPSRIPFRNTVCRAALAAFRAFAASSDFSAIARASCGLRSKKSASPSATTASTADFASGFPSFALVWPSNCGSLIFTETTAVIPSRTSSPVSASSPFKRLFFFAQSLSMRVKAERKPVICVPPSGLWILFANPSS